jgi:hypothetical protein
MNSGPDLSGIWTPSALLTCIPLLIICSHDKDFLL